MVDVTLRSDLSRPLTWTEVDTNFTNLKTAAEAVASAENVTFVQDGTVAVSRTSQQKMREKVSVVDFGALGDGSTDDAAAIQAAIAAHPEAEIWFPPGIYAVGTTILLDAEAICLKGSNAGGYVFGNNTGLTEGAVLKWSGAGDGTLRQVGSTTTRRGIQVKDMQLDGDNLGGTCLHVVNASNSYFERLVIKDAYPRYRSKSRLSVCTQ